MELFGMVLSLPASFVAVSVYTFILKWVLNRWAWLSGPARWASYFIVALACLEGIGVATVGTLKLRATVGAIYYPIHFFLFLLGTPALADSMQIQKRFPFLAKWYITSAVCMIFAFGLVLLQYAVTDDLFGIDGVGGPYKQTYPF